MLPGKRDLRASYDNSTIIVAIVCLVMAIS